MGGFGSTRWGGHRPRYTTAQLPALHLEDLQLGQLLATGQPHHQVPFVFRAAGLPTDQRGLADVDLTEPERGTVDLRLPGGGLAAGLCLQPMRTCWGAWSWYVRCPGCGRRARRVYFGPGLLRGCRRCRNLAHPLAQLDKLYRPMEAQRARRLHLGGSTDLSEPFPAKPPYMRWAKYWAAVQRDEELEAASWRAVAHRFRRFG